ncbi:MAG: transketolase [Candidatus Cloacimonetes bacterium]|nr:transketolase [Candidatus Cloacimonadota bacterium]
MMNLRFSIEQLTELSRICKGDILKMTTIAESGHPGGSMSSLDLYLALYAYANITPENRLKENRDRIVISHGHTAPGIYSVLGHFGFFNIDDAIAYFRKVGSIFEGHIEPEVPGIEWATGNLGQGLSAGAGFALAGKQKGLEYNVYVCMGDGEQQKGQLTEARRFAKKYGLSNITALVDYNQLQISGSVHDVMPQNIKENYLSDGWDVIEINGHDFNEIFSAVDEANACDNPSVIIAHTVMGHGISFMENDEDFHGKALTYDECSKALSELGLANDIDKYIRMRENFVPIIREIYHPNYPHIETGEAIFYSKEKPVACRNAYGKALADLAQINKKVQFAVFDCDLAGSVKTSQFAQENPAEFYQGGIQEHNTAVVAGVMSKENIITFFSDFGVFGVDETYNQQRLNDINRTNLKLVTTHVGLNVGEDGKTHQCIDYISLMSNLYGFRVIIPADGNQADKIIRYITSMSGNFYVSIGRSGTAIITDENGNEFYGKNYVFRYGSADHIREGKDAALIATGVMVEKAMRVYEILKRKGISIDVWNISSISEIQEDDLKKIAECKNISTYEDHNVNTGMGSIIAAKMNQLRLDAYVHPFGVTQYGMSGCSEDVYHYLHLDADFVAEEIYKNLS